MTRLDRAAHKLAEAASAGALTHWSEHHRRWRCDVCASISATETDHDDLSWHGPACLVRLYREAKAAKKGRAR